MQHELKYTTMHICLFVLYFQFFILKKRYAELFIEIQGHIKVQLCMPTVL